MPRVAPNFWFATEAEEAAQFYVSVFPNSRITAVTLHTDATPGPTGEVLAVAFELDGQHFEAINGATDVPFTPALSLSIDCADQAEVDHYWERLTDGGAESVCGWLRDRFGVSWQVIPSILPRLVADPDPERSRRALAAMVTMTKIDVDALVRAVEGAES